MESKPASEAPFLRDYQIDAVNRMRNGCILNGGVGTGKSRTGLYYYFKEQGGSFDANGYPRMEADPPKDLYIVTTAAKRDKCEWDLELAHFLLSKHPDANAHGNAVTIDSWNNIGKYTDVAHAFFIFDEDRVCGNGAWVKAFLKIAKTNDWIILSATPGDTWSDYIPVFIANGFYKNRTEFTRRHVVYSRYAKYPKVDRYVDIGRLVRLRNRILVDMDAGRTAKTHNIDLYLGYDLLKYKEAGRTRWDPYKNKPMERAADLCYVWRRITNSDPSRAAETVRLVHEKKRAIVFYNFDYELEILKSLDYGKNTEVAEWNGHKHQELPDSAEWVYLVQYNAGAEGWNCTKTDTVIFYSQTYSYKTLEQAKGRINRLNSPYTELYYYHLKSKSGIDMAIEKALRRKKNFNETRFVKWDG